MKIKSLSKVIFASLLGVGLFASAGEARIVPQCVPMLTYANATVPTYDNPGGEQKGFISPNVSLIMIKELRKDGWAYGSYPIAGGKRIYRWFRMIDVQGYGNFKNYPVTFDSAQTVYRAVTGNAIVGALSAGVEATVVGESGNNLKVIYKVSGGNEYKMGWIPLPQEDNSNAADVGSSLGNFKGNIVVVQGDVINSGKIDASTNDNSVTDNSYRDNSKHNTNVNVDNSYNDNSKHTNINKTDNSKNTNIRNTDNSRNTTNIDSFNNTSFESDNPNSEGNRRKRSRGDLNDDGKVNFEDMLLLAKHLKGKTKLSAKKADINRDGQVNKADFDALLKIVKQAKGATGDLNNDGKLDTKDLELMQRLVNEKKFVADANLKGKGQTLTSEDISKLREILDLLK